MPLFIKGESTSLWIPVFLTNIFHLIGRLSRDDVCSQPVDDGCPFRLPYRADGWKAFFNHVLKLTEYHHAGHRHHPEEGRRNRYVSPCHHHAHPFPVCFASSSRKSHLNAKRPQVSSRGPDGLGLLWGNPEPYWLVFILLRAWPGKKSSLIIEFHAKVG